LKHPLVSAQIASENHSDIMQRRKFSATSLNEIWKHINELKISKIDLSLGDVEKILDTVVYDGLAVKDSSSSAGSFYTARNWATTHIEKQPKNGTNGYVQIPCAFCPVASDCRPKGLISPATCVYLNEWLAE